MTRYDISGQPRRAFLSGLAGAAVLGAGCSETEESGADAETNNGTGADSDGESPEDGTTTDPTELQEVPQNWATELGLENGQDVESASLSGDTLVVWSDAGLDAFDTESGTRRWEWSSPATIQDMTTDDESVYTVIEPDDESGTSGELITFEPASGSVTWRTGPLEEGFVAVTPTADYIVAETYSFTEAPVYDKRTGEQALTVDTDISEVVAVGDNQILNNDSLSTQKYDLDTGEQLWEYDLPEFSYPFALVDGIMMGVTDDDVLKCIDLQTEQPSKNIAESTGIPQMPLVAGQQYAFGHESGDGGGLYALDPNGSIAWQKEPSDIYTSLGVGAGTVALALFDQLHVYEQNSGTKLGERDLPLGKNAVARSGRQLYVCGSTVASYRLPRP